MTTPVAREEAMRLALEWYANWQDNITGGVHDHGTDDGRSVPDMGRRAHDALLGIDVSAPGYDESIEASQLARWGGNPTEEPHDPYVRCTPNTEETQMERNWLIGPTERGTEVLDGPAVTENVAVVPESEHAAEEALKRIARGESQPVQIARDYFRGRTVTMTEVDP